MSDLTRREGAPVVRNGTLWAEGAEVDLWISCHGYESRSTKHLELPVFSAGRKLSVGFDFPEDPEFDVQQRLDLGRGHLKDAGFEVIVTDDSEFDRLVTTELRGSPSGRRQHVLADISSMNRTRIASLVLACASRWRDGCDLDLIYFPSTFESHKHEYEPLETFGPVNDEMAGWPAEPDFPMALVVGLGTEPRRADGIVESIEPDILSLFEPVGDEPAYSNEVREENRRVLEVGGQPVLYDLRDPEAAHNTLLATVERLTGRARVVVVPLGPKIFAALAVGVAIAVGPDVGVWKASAGRRVTTVDVKGANTPLVARMSFGIEAAGPT